MEHWLRNISKEPPRWSAHGPRPISVLPALEAHVDEASAKAETATRISAGAYGLSHALAWFRKLQPTSGSGCGECKTSRIVHLWCLQGLGLVTYLDVTEILRHSRTRSVAGHISTSTRGL